jgi:hypothetical protein
MNFLVINFLFYKDLSSNKLSGLKEGTFKDLNQLEILLLDNNEIAYILKDTFLGLENVKQLSLGQNKIIFINVKAFRHMKCLELNKFGEFYLNKNPIDRIRLEEGMVYFY